MSSNSPISRFENFARYLIEGSFDRLLRQPGPLAEVAAELVATAEDSSRDGLLANRYAVRAHPDHLVELGRQSTNVAALMEGMLARYGEQNHLVFAGPLSVELIPDDSMEPGYTAITSRRDEGEEEPTAVLSRVVSRSDKAKNSPASQKKGATAPLTMPEAYLIVNGRRHIALDKAIVAIGRSLDNDVILEDSGVSRAHAQLRWRNGQFEIFDLGSRAGTLVNGRSVTRAALKSGDVISLGAAAVIYGEEDGQSDAAGPAQRLSVDITQEFSVDE